MVRLIEPQGNPGRRGHQLRDGTTAAPAILWGTSAWPMCDGCGRNFSIVARLQVPTDRRHVGPTIHFDRPVQELPPLTSSDFRCGPATLWAERRAWAMGAAELFKFRPLDKDDAVPTVRKAVRGRYDGRPNRYTVQRPDGA
jgi:hypothetical protein